MVPPRDRNIPIPSWVRKWLVFNAAILIFDGGFCVLRPYSLGDGWIGTFFYGYRYYVDTDIHYADTEDSYIWAQGWLSVIEGFLNLAAYFNCLRGLQKTKLLVIATSIMTSWKSLLFILYSTDYPRGGHVVPSWTKEFLVVYLVPVFWVIFPIHPGVELSVIEGFLNLAAYFNCLRGLQKTKLLVIATSIMTSWKSLLFILYSTDYPRGGHVVPSWTKEFLIVYLAPVFWVIFPAYVAYRLALDFKPRRRRSRPSRRDSGEEEEYEYEFILPEGENSAEEDEEESERSSAEASDRSSQEGSSQETENDSMNSLDRKADTVSLKRDESSLSTNQETLDTDKGGEGSSLDNGGDTLGNDVGPDWSTDGSENGDGEKDKRGITRYNLRKRMTVP